MAIFSDSLLLKPLVILVELNAQGRKGSLALLVNSTYHDWPSSLANAVPEFIHYFVYPELRTAFMDSSHSLAFELWLREYCFYREQQDMDRCLVETSAVWMRYDHHLSPVSGQNRLKDIFPQAVWIAWQMDPKDHPDRVPLIPTGSNYWYTRGTEGSGVGSWRIGEQEKSSG